MVRASIFQQIPHLELFLRLAYGMFLGILLGLDREIRGAPAGIRTHGLVSLSAATVTACGLLIFAEVRAAGSSDSDPLRVVQGIYQAIGFIGAGLVFARHGAVHNLTTAASITLATAMGIAAGAGEYALAGMATALGMFLLGPMRRLARLIPGSDKRQED